MAKFNVRKSIVIEAPIGKVHGIIRDFKQWAAWSPWLIAEPDSKMTYFPENAGYAWEGSIVGSGEMKFVSEEGQGAIHCDLTFLKPWKSHAKIGFLLEDKGGSTEVAWLMEGNLPLVMVFFRNLLSAKIGTDFDRGLKMLKDHVETGSVPCKLEFTGRTSVAGCAYVGVRTECPIEQIGPHMEKDFGTLQQFISQKGLECKGKPFAIYHKWNMTGGTCSYTIGYGVQQVPTDLPVGILSGNLPACETFAIKSTGPYRHLANAWAAGMMRAQTKVFNQAKKPDPFEIYENNPAETPENDLVTVVHFPVK